MNVWEKYSKTLKKNILNPNGDNKDVKYWRNDMFANTLIYIIPFCFITLIPSLIWAIDSGLYVMVAVDLLAVLTVIGLGFKSKLSISSRKQIFIATIYILSFCLVYYVGLNSSLYLIIACFLSVFIYAFKNQYLPAFLNLFISLVLFILFGIFGLPEHVTQFQLSEMIAVFSTVCFLSFLTCALVSKLFEGLDRSFDENFKQTKEITKQNDTLKEITWIQSHVVRGPLTRLMSITILLEEPGLKEEDRDYLLKNVKITSDEIDLIIKDIVLKSEGLYVDKEKA